MHTSRNLLAHNALERLVQKFSPGSALVRAWELKGGVSAEVVAIEIQCADGSLQKFVVRQPGDAHAADEFRLLQALQTAKIAVPAPYYVDAASEVFETPCLVIEFVESQTQFAIETIPDMVRQLATQLARIHAVRDIAPLSFLPRQRDITAAKLRVQPAVLDARLNEGRIRDALVAAWPWPQHNADVLLHGDFWSGNVLWRDDQIVAVIDWEDAALGDPLADLANSRLEVLFAFGAEAMQQFTQHYQAQVTLDFTTLPYWDLYAALKPASKLWTWGLGEATENAMAEAQTWFVAQALKRL